MIPSLSLGAGMGYLIGVLFNRVSMYYLKKNRKEIQLSNKKKCPRWFF
jgi:hypothetical protein